MKSIYVPMNGESGGHMGPNGKLQTRRIKAFLKKRFPMAEIKFSAGHYYSSAFLDFGNGRIIYMSTSDYRHFDQSYLVRIADHDEDYTGGTNHNYTGFDSIGSAIADLYRKIWANL